MAHHEATWDLIDDWTTFTPNGQTEVSFSRITSGFHLAYNGGVGKLTDAWTSGSGTHTFKFASSTSDGRSLRLSVAIDFAEIAWSGSAPQHRRGPILINCKDGAGATLTDAISLRTSKRPADASNPERYEVRLYDNVSGNQSDETIFIDNRTTWFLFDFRLDSTGDSDPFTVTAECDVWEENGTRTRYLGTLKIDAPSTTIKHFHNPSIGFRVLQKPGDQYTLWLDEYRMSLDEGDVPLPRARRGRLSSYPATVRIRRYDRPTMTWTTVLEIPPTAITEIRATFLAQRAEDTLSVSAVEPGYLTETKLRRLARDLERHVEDLYRVDLYVPDESYPNPTWPANWQDPVLFWSGLLDRRAVSYDLADGSIAIEAIGWTSYLNKVTLQRKEYAADDTVETVLADVVAALQTAWPGTLSEIDDVGHAATKRERLNVQLKVQAATVREVLDELTKRGAYYYGVVVSGYPLADVAPAIPASPKEFRFFFYEARTEVLSPRDATGSEWWGDLVFDTLSIDDPRVISFSRAQQQGGLPNRVLALGAAATVTIRSVVGGLDETLVRDYRLGTYPETEPWSGPLGLVGLSIRFIGIWNDSNRQGQLVGVDGFFSVPESLQVTTQIAEAVTLSSAIDLEVEPDLVVPALYDSLDLSTKFSGIGYEIVSTGLRVIRKFADEESIARREDELLVIDDANVRGDFGAAMAAHLAIWKAARQSETATLSVRGWRRAVGHDRNTLLTVLDPDLGRLTRLGMPGAGGDGFTYWKDTRALGPGRTFEVLSVEWTWGEDGANVQFHLGSAREELANVVVAAEPTS